MKSFVTPAQRTAIADAIRATETRTRGELVAVIAGSAGHYTLFPLLYAALLALLTPLALSFIAHGLSAEYAYALQLGVFASAAMLLSWQPLKVRIVPARIQIAHARRLAREQFFARKMHHTRERSGIMIFVSVAERYVEIIADQGINDQVAAGTWDGIVRDLIAAVQRGENGAGMVAAINACAGILAQHLPVRADDKNELANELIELP
ncbi:MAG: TPM domain-containing protein [Pseudomonadota bacterium]